MNSDDFNFNGLHVLSIDDNIVDNKMLSLLLKDTGIILETAVSLPNAIEKIRSVRFDAIFVDHMMPEYDGINVLKYMRENHLCDGVPVIVVTANNLASAKENYLKIGFNGYVSKPIDKMKLLNVLHDCLYHDSVRNDGATKPKVHIIDDDRMNLLVAQKILSGYYLVSTSNSGKSALEYLRNNPVDMILLDLRMPELDGFQFMEIAKNDELLEDIPIICLTADDDHDSELRCFELGALDFITKPFIAEIMRQRVSRILEIEYLHRSLKSEVDKQTEELYKKSCKLGRLTKQVMVTLASTIDAKDKYTNGHSVRVAEYSRMIAEKMNMSRQEQEDIYYIGLLHDIGKIGIPDEIINKTSRLTDEEYMVIKTHPTIGAQILEKMSELPDIAIGAKYHHERYDGRGYPEGLKGEEIPMIARIIGVADAYDAMTSNRSYRSVLSQDVVRSEIEKGIGTQFDPIFAKIMLTIIDEDVNYLLRENQNIAY